MKKLIFILSLFGGLSISTLNAQPGTDCGGYPHLLNISGFYSDCGNSDGKICFDYTAEGWNPFDDCEDLVVEISFPTGSLTNIVPGNFTTSYAAGGTITKLTLDPAPLSSGAGSECIEATLSIANTTFTKKIYYASSPGTTFLMNTFKVDNIIAVGGSGTTDLTSLTGIGGPLLPPTNGTPQRIAVDGTLNIDEDYFFTTSFNNSNSKYSELIMMPDSKITVEGPYTLHTSLANIHGCEGSSWEGIELLSINGGGTLDMGVRTTLSDAIVGVEMNNLTKFHITDSEIRNCGIGLASFGATPRTITFDGVNNPAGNLISNFTACDEGIHLENTTKLDMTMNTGLPYLNFWNINDFAIYLENTDLEAKDLEYLWLRKWGMG